MILCKKDFSIYYKFMEKSPIVFFDTNVEYLKEPKKLYGVYDCQNIYYTLQDKLCFNFKDLEELVCLI